MAATPSATETTGFWELLPPELSRGLGAAFATRGGAKAAFEELLNVLFAEVRNPHTRAAYQVAWRRFFDFCQAEGLALDQVRPSQVGLWVERHPGSRATVRQHLAAVRRLYDALALAGAVEFNPAARVKGPPDRTARGLTPVLEAREAALLLKAAEGPALIDRRDHALFSLLLYTFCRVSAMVGLRQEDYYLYEGLRLVRLREKRSKVLEVPLHPAAVQSLERWLDAAGIRGREGWPLLTALDRDRRTAVNRPLARHSVWSRVRARLAQAGLEPRYGCHSFRATGITLFCRNGGSLEQARRIAGHEQLATTKRYDRSGDAIAAAELARIVLPDV